MKNQKRIGTCIAVLAAVSVLGATVYGIGNIDEKPEMTDQVTLDNAVDLDSGVKLESAAAEVADAIEEIPAQDEASLVDGLPNVTKVATDVMPAIVAITNKTMTEISFMGRSWQQEATGAGSGIIVAKTADELLIATNNHVVEDADELTVCFSVDAEDEDDLLAPALIKGTDVSTDLAVIAVKLKDISQDVVDKIGIVQLGDSDSLQLGQWVVAIGNALGLGQSVTSGVVSALDCERVAETSNGYETFHLIMTDAAINSGNSGGALLDMSGRLVGINSGRSVAYDAENMGYAIPINAAKPIIEELMNQTTRERVDEEKSGVLGVYVRDVTSEAQELYHVPAGAQVYGFYGDSSAEDAGIQEYDIITKIDDVKINSRDQLINRMYYYEAGETVTVTLMRFEESSGYVEKQYQVKLGKRSDIEKSIQDQEEDDDYDDNYNSYGNNGNGNGLSINDLFGSFGF